MTEFLLEINDSGDTLEINDSADQLLILDDTVPAPPTGGGSGGRAKQVGKSVFATDRSLGERPVLKSSAEAIARLEIKSLVRVFGALLMPLKLRAESLVTPKIPSGYSVSKLFITEKLESIVRIQVKVRDESLATMNLASYLVGAVAELKTHFKTLAKLKKLEMLHDIFKNMDKE